MIIEIPDENSEIKWKYTDNEDWKYAEISDLIKAYERPSDEVIIAHERIAYERGVADGYAEALEEMKDKERPQGKWKLIKANEYENDVNGEYYINTYVCPFCNWEVRTEGEMEYRFCPMCNADLRGEKNDK